MFNYTLIEVTKEKMKLKKVIASLIVIVGLTLGSASAFADDSTSKINTVSSDIQTMKVVSDPGIGGG